MIKWLVIAALGASFAGGQVAAQMKGHSPAEIAGVARTRALDLRISQMPSMPTQPPLVASMLVSRELAPNARIGVGLASIYGRKKSGGEMRINGGPGRSRKPAVTFVLRF